MRGRTMARGGSGTSAVLALAASLLLAACAQRALLDKIAPADDQVLSAQIMSDLQGRPDGEADLTNLLIPQLRDKLAPELPKMRSAMPVGPSRLVDASVRNFYVFNGSPSRQSYLAYEVDGAKNARALVRIWISRENGVARLQSLHVNRLSVPAEQLGAFTLAGKSPVQYLILALAVLSPLTILWSEIVLFRTKWIRLKWLWAVACLFGYGQLSVDWSSGEVGFTPLYITLFGAFAFKAGMLAPWRVGFALPVASIAFLASRRRLQKPPIQSDEGLTGATS